MPRLLLAALVLAILALSPGAIAFAQAEADPSGSPAPSASPEVPAQASMPTFSEPRWQKVSVGTGPAAREDHTWVVDDEGRFAYLFGGRDGGKSYDDLWRYALETDTWARLKPPGQAPSARFGHSAVWVDGLGMVVFAGQRGTDFFGDLWVYDPVDDRWNELPASGDVPKPRYGSCMIVGPDGRIWISHGFTFTGRFDDTRAYNLKAERWAAITPPGRKPGERCLHDCFTASNGEMVLYGGQDNSVGALGDLWLTTASGSWKQEADPKAKPRRLYAVTEAGGDAYIFGGAGKDDQTFDDLWRVDRETLAFEPVKVAGPGPSGRSAGTLITDVVRGRLLLFGGKGAEAKADVWQLVELSSPTEAESNPEAQAPVSSEAPASSDEDA